MQEFDFDFQEGVSVLKSKHAFQYLKERGALQHAILNRWKYTPYKIRIPIYQYGVCVGMLDRQLKKDVVPKYLFSSNFKSTLLFYNFDNAKFKKTLVLNEGVFDVISTQESLPQCGVLGLFGKQISKERLSMLRDLEPEEVVLMLDSPEKDKEVEKSVSMLSDLLKGFVSTSIASLSGGDPNEVSASEIQRAYFERRKL